MELEVRRGGGGAGGGGADNAVSLAGAAPRRMFILWKLTQLGRRFACFTSRMLHSDKKLKIALLTHFGKLIFLDYHNQCQWEIHKTPLDNANRQIRAYVSDILEGTCQPSSQKKKSTYPPGAAFGSTIYQPELRFSLSHTTFPEWTLLTVHLINLLLRFLIHLGSLILSSFWKLQL